MAVIKISVIDTDTRWAKEIRFLGIPVYLVRVLDLKTKKTPERRQIRFNAIGDTSLLEVDDDDEEDIDTKTYGVRK